MARPSPAPLSERTRRASPPLSLTGGGTTGNERLTSLAGAALLVLLAVIGVSILRIRPLLWVHMFVGLLLIGPVALKMASTGYRFVRYYNSEATYRRKGPPATPLRLLAPVLVTSTVVVLASGVALLFAGPSSRDTLMPFHKVGFIIWGVVFVVHVLAHLPRLGRALQADYGRRALGGDLGGRAGRVMSLAGALVGGLVVALVLIPKFGPWIAAAGRRH